MGDPGPVFLAGADRSGIGLVGELLNAHPNVFVSRRTRFWTFYYGRFGDLGQPSNLEEAIDAMMRYSRILELDPDRERLLAEFPHQPGTPGYGTLFELLHRHHLERIGKRRWGDKTLNAERHATTIFGEYPDARMIHVIRDPRDRYASQALHRNASRGGIGAGMALWLSSFRHARRNRATYPGRYEVVRYEDLVSDPVTVVEGLCAFIGEPFDQAMLDAPGPPQSVADRGAAGAVRGLVPAPVGRYLRDLSVRDIAFIQVAARRPMREMGYERTPTPLSTAERLRFAGVDIPRGVAQMAAWLVNMRRRERTGGSPAARRLADADDE